MFGVVVLIVIVLIVILTGAILGVIWLLKQRKLKNYERALKMVPMLIHLPPSTDDIEAKGRDERDVVNEQLSQAQVLYSILASTLTKGVQSKIFGQRHFTFEIIAKDGLIKYYTNVPAVLTETVKQAVVSAYPTARLEEVEMENIFSETGKSNGVVGGEMELKTDFCYPINTYEETKRDASLAILSAMSTTKKGEGMALQLLLRPTSDKWIDAAKKRTASIRDGKGNNKGAFVAGALDSTGDVLSSLWKVPEKKDDKPGIDQQPLTNLQQAEIEAIEKKTNFPAFETSIRLIASSPLKERSEAMLGGLVASFAQFDSPNMNGFKYRIARDPKQLATDFIFRFFPQRRAGMILNSVELASIFHLPAQNSIPTAQVERQLTKQVDGPAKLVTEGTLLGINEFRGEKKEIRLSVDDRQRHLYTIGQTGMGKSVFLENIAYQDMINGNGFAFLDPHGDAIEAILKRVPKERIDDIVLFDPTDIEHPIGMNMFEYTTDDQKDFIVQEGINMLQSLFDPNNQGFFGALGQHMFRNAALLLMSDPHGATFIDIPQCFIDPEFVKSKLKYVTDKSVFDYWTKEFPASQQSSESGEVKSWFNSKWGPFLSNTMMRNILGQTKSGFNIREIMDNKKIFLVNLSKGGLGEQNSKLLGMILVMKFQAAAMSRQDIPEDQREDFCLFVDEFQNFATESFESILSEARKYKLNLVVANQFMTQLTDKIREGILGNVGTIVCGRIGVTDAELMEKAFSPTFTAEDLHKQANHHAIATVMMYGMPSAPFTMRLPAPMGEPNDQLMKTIKEYAMTKFGKTRAEVEKEISQRLSAKDATSKPSTVVSQASSASSEQPQTPMAPTSTPSAKPPVASSPITTDKSQAPSHLQPRVKSTQPEKTQPEPISNSAPVFGSEPELTAELQSESKPDSEPEFINGKSKAVKVAHAADSDETMIKLR